LSCEGSGDKTGKTICLFLSPEIGPTTRMLGLSLLYGWIKTPFVLALISSERRSFGANLKPSGNTKTEPTFNDPRFPLAVTCFTEVS
jgi:hypothetical protein